MRTRTLPRPSMLSTGICLAVLAACGGAPPPPAAPSTPAGDHYSGSVGAATSVTQVTEEDLRAHRTGRLEDVLATRAPGVQVTRGPHGLSLRIRGQSSLMLSNEPLIVLDGVILNRNGAAALSMLNPRDISNVSILRDAASTAIYGSRGANGVIVIRTKTGR